MAVVYKVWHTGLQRFEALKIPHFQSTLGPESDFVQRLLSEARMAARLHHPHIVAIHNVSEADAPIQYFSMDLVDGQDLQKLIKARGRLSLGETVTILRHVAEALDYAHANSVVHRDIKPANILLQKDGDRVVAKVVDFGISRAGEEDSGTRMTGSGVYIGTPEYMSPEQSGSGHPVDRRTDLYSLGVVAYEMLLGQPPFIAEEGVNRISIILKHVNTPPPSPIDADGELPEYVNDAILQALEKDPAERFTTCSGFVAALQGQECGAVAFGVPVERRNERTRATTTIATSDDRLGTRRFRVPARGTVTMAAEPLETSVASGLRRTLHTKAKLRRSTVLAGIGGLLAGSMLIYGASGRMQFGPQAPAPPSVPGGPMTTAILAPPHPAFGPAIAQAAIPTPNRIARLHQFIALPYPTHWRDSKSLPVGRRSIIQHGLNGQREQVLEVSYRDGLAVGRRSLLDRVVQAPRPEIELIGTAPSAGPHAAGAAHAAMVAHATQAPHRTVLAQTAVTHHVAHYAARREYRARDRTVSEDWHERYAPASHPFADTHTAHPHDDSDDNFSGPMTYIGPR